MEALIIEIKELVQGSGFLAFVEKSACQNNIVGWIEETPLGAEIFAQGESDDLDAFIMIIAGDISTLACVRELDIKEVSCKDLSGFSIKHISEYFNNDYHEPSSNIALCKDCKKELEDKTSRFYRYPFLSCSKCGPRFSIAKRRPFTRENTVLSEVKPCEACLKDAANKESEQYCNNIVSCFNCGPSLNFVEEKNHYKVSNRNSSEQMLESVQNELRKGNLISLESTQCKVRFYLLAASCTERIKKVSSLALRRNDLFGIIPQSFDSAKKYCSINKLEESYIEGIHPAAVLCEVKQDFADCISQSELAVLMPFNALLQLISSDFADDLFFVAIKNADKNVCSYEKYFSEKLNAKIIDTTGLSNIDYPSVLRLLHLGKETQAVQYLARDFAHKPLSVESPVFVNEEQALRCEDSYVLARKNKAWVYGKEEKYLSEVYKDLLSFEANFKKADASYHHALPATVMAEHKITGPLASLILDCPMPGLDGSLWGGECLFVNQESFERFANIAYVPICPLHINSASILNLYALLWSCDLLENKITCMRFNELGMSVEQAERIVHKQVSLEATSSLSHMFDMAALLLGFCNEIPYIGYGMSLLLSHAKNSSEFKNPASNSLNSYQFGVSKNTANKESTAQDTSVLLLDIKPMFQSALQDLEKEVNKNAIAARFVQGVITSLAALGQLINLNFGLQEVALVGSACTNRDFFELLIKALVEKGITPVISKNLPPTKESAAYGALFVSHETNNLE